MTQAQSPQTTFPRTHLAMMCKYSGISFISGAVNHGFFSGERSLITAALGIVLFAVGAVMEHRANAAAGEGSDSLLKTLLLGALLSIGLGFFTGGLQHFPDSPARSSWVVPLGFVVSVLALFATLKQRWEASTTRYAVIASLLVAVLSWAGGRYLAGQPQEAAHQHGEAAMVDPHAGHGNKAASNTSDNASTQAYKTANDAMHKGMDIAFTGDADADFLAGMVPHHQGAIDMARVVIAHGKDPKIKALAQAIITAQEKEIADMKSWQQGAAPSASANANASAKPVEDHSKHKH
jgi:Domain of unknown function (DUF305)